MRFSDFLSQGSLAEGVAEDGGEHLLPQLIHLSLERPEEGRVVAVPRRRAAARRPAVEVEVRRDAVWGETRLVGVDGVYVGVVRFVWRRQGPVAISFFSSFSFPSFDFFSSHSSPLFPSPPYSFSSSSFSSCSLSRHDGVPGFVRVVGIRVRDVL